MTDIHHSPALAVGVSAKLRTLKRAGEYWRGVRTAIFDRYHPELHYARTGSKKPEEAIRLRKEREPT
jgi:hypothetical protein